MLRKNTASQFMYIAAVNATTGAALTGATISGRRCLDGTFAVLGATITEDTGLGFYKVAFTQADTNGNLNGYFFTATNMVPIEKTIVTTACDPTSAAFGLLIAKTTNITGFNDIAAPTGFAAATFPATVASTTNITAGTITTASNLTTNNDKTGYALTAGERNSVADALLGRNVAGGSSTGRIVSEALYVLRNKVQVAVGTMTVYLTDDTTPAFTATVTTAAGDPISTIDPA